MHGRQLLRNPGNAELDRRDRAARARVSRRPTCGLLVVGSGPAGLSAAVYGASEGTWRSWSWTPSPPGGQAATSSLIENYLGFPAGISGAELAERAALQARKFGARFAVPAEGHRHRPA